MLGYNWEVTEDDAFFFQVRCTLTSTRRKKAVVLPPFPVPLVSQACHAGLSLVEPPQRLAFKAIPTRMARQGPLCLFSSRRCPDFLTRLSSSPPRVCLKTCQAARTVESSEYKPYTHQIPGQTGTLASLAHTSYPTDLICMFFHRPCQCILSLPFS